MSATNPPPSNYDGRTIGPHLASRRAVAMPPRKKGKGDGAASAFWSSAGALLEAFFDAIVLRLQDMELNEEDADFQAVCESRPPHLRDVEPMGGCGFFALAGSIGECNVPHSGLASTGAAGAIVGRCTAVSVRERHMEMWMRQLVAPRARTFATLVSHR